MNSDQTTLFAMPNMLNLGKRISKILKVPLTTIDRNVFSDGEVLLRSTETVRSKDVFVIASTSPPVNDNLMELLLFIDSLKRGSAKSINIVLTYYGYSRQDRKESGRQPIGAKLVADLLERAGATRVIALDLHNASIQGFFNIPVDDLRALYIIAPHIKSLGHFTVVSPDHGGAVRARLLAELLSNDVNVAIIDKRRNGPNSAEIMGVLGDVKGKNIIIIDDMVDTGGTILKAARVLRQKGAKKILVAATHGLFTTGFELFDSDPNIDQVVVTDSVATVNDIKSNKLKVISLDSFVAQTIKATVESNSITELYAELRKKLL